MGGNHEKGIDGSAVREGNSRAGRGTANARHSSGRSGERTATSDVREGAKPHSRSRVAGGKSGVGSAQKGRSSSRVRASDGNLAGTASVHREEVGARRGKKVGNAKLKAIAGAIQKGGQGKTSQTVHISFALEEMGIRAAVIDCDTQASASWTLSSRDSGYPASALFTGTPEQLRAYFDERDNSGLSLIAADDALADVEKMDRPEAMGNFRANMEALGDYVDVAVIDTPPSLGVILSAALVSSDYVFCPLEMEAYSLQGIEKLLTVIHNLMDYNPGLEFIGMIPNKIDSRKPRHLDNLAQVKNAYPDLVAPVAIGLRDSIAEAVGDQMPVWHVKKTAARVATKEMRAMIDYVFKKMELV